METEFSIVKKGPSIIRILVQTILQICSSPLSTLFFGYTGKQLNTLHFGWLWYGLRKVSFYATEASLGMGTTGANAPVNFQKTSIAPVDFS